MDELKSSNLGIPGLFSSLKDIAKELMHQLKVQGMLNRMTWIKQAEKCWEQEMQREDIQGKAFAGLIQNLADHLEREKMGEFWENRQGKWIRRGNSAEKASEIAAILYSLIIAVPGNRVSHPQDWEDNKFQWMQILSRFSRQEASQIRSKIRFLYGLDRDELGFLTLGHRCITEKEKENASADGSDLLFGEILAEGVQRAFDVEHLDAANAEVVYDLGMGLGKLALHVFLDFPNIKSCVGVELSSSRFTLGQNAMKRLHSSNWDQYEIVHDSTSRISLRDSKGRLLEFRNQNLFDCRDSALADIVVLETHFPQEVWPRLCEFLIGMKKGARILTYENLEAIFRHVESIQNPFVQLDINRSTDDRFYTTWSIRRGHHFFLWTKRI